jgi:hypothetical protein
VHAADDPLAATIMADGQSRLTVLGLRQHMHPKLHVMIP